MSHYPHTVSSLLCSTANVLLRAQSLPFETIIIAIRLTSVNLHMQMFYCCPIYPVKRGPTLPHTAECYTVSPCNPICKLLHVTPVSQTWKRGLLHMKTTMLISVSLASVQNPCSKGFAFMCWCGVEVSYLSLAVHSFILLDSACK